MVRKKPKHKLLVIIKEIGIIQKSRNININCLKKGDIFVVGQQWGKVRALFDDKKEKIDFALPSTPVEVLGLNGTPEAGDILNVLPSEAKAREISLYREQNLKNKKNTIGMGSSLDQ